MQELLSGPSEGGCLMWSHVWLVLVIVLATYLLGSWWVAR
jgi:hypothetical protein